MKESQHYFEELEEKLYSAVISDILDLHDYRNQAMHSNIRPLAPDMVVVGRAKTVQVAEVYRIPEKPYDKQIQVLDDIQPGEVFVGGLNGAVRSAFFGELMSTAVKTAGGRGAIIDGLIRDAKQILKLGFPIFSTGFRPTDSLGRNEVIEYDVSIVCGGVTIEPGDLVFGDMDGVVVIPRKIEDQVIQEAMEKANSENQIREKIRNGMKVSDVFQKYGIL